MKQTLYINLYRAGWWHQQGKPNTTNLHAGDVYTTLGLAIDNVTPERGYVDTVPIEVDLPGTVLANGPDSVPTPLGDSRRAMAGMSSNSGLLPYLVPEAPAAYTPSLEVGDGHFGVGYDEWVANGGLAAIRENDLLRNVRY